MIFIISQINFNELILKLHQNYFSLIFASFLIQHLSLISSSYRSKIYLQSTGIYLSQAQNIILYYIGSFYNNFLPGGVGGDGYKIYFLSKRYAIKKIILLKAFLLERINGIFVLGYLSCLLYHWSDFSLYFNCLTYFVLFVTIIGIPTYILLSKLLFKDTFAIRALPFSVCTQILQLVMIFLIILSFNRSLDIKLIIDYILLFSIASILSVFPITIGSIGVRETVFLIGTNLIPDLDQGLGILFASTSFLVALFASLTGGILILYPHEKNSDPSSSSKTV